MQLESPKTKVHKSSEELFNFLIDVKNFETLMPENISKFEVLEEGKFVFALKGMPEIILKLKEEHPFHKIVLGAASDKIPFNLTADIKEIDSSSSEAQLTFEGEFNAMMAMMIKGPITSFIKTLSEKMGNL
ncbi:SRPBCC family protein [Ascidiimonas sp. W6]|uniref:SRPBCC family protein n=1 Tax=Ascidiimonas meishanensis TaxID=3128903 RepID=UPI0030ECE8A7